MKLEDQVVSLELAKKQKELGVRQESAFYWWNDRFDTKAMSDNWRLRKTFSRVSEKAIAAFTVAELFEQTIKESNLSWIIFYSVRNCEWHIRNNDAVFDGQEWHFTEPNLSDALAKMLIHLIEKGIVKP